MIALTKEKREELVERYNQQILTFKYHLSKIGQEHFDGKAYAEILLKTEIALAALTAEPVLYAVDSDVEDKIYTALCNENEDGAYPLFTAPPVPEIKLPHELLDLINAVDFYHKVKAENPEVEIGAWNDAYDWIKKAAIEAAPVIKSLNGLGE